MQSRHLNWRSWRGELGEAEVRDVGAAGTPLWMILWFKSAYWASKFSTDLCSMDDVFMNFESGY
jgi:hypothetical protein